jgi:pimeloyl-ACP methyl ester carboxylesterase
VTRRKPRNRAQQDLDWPPRERYATREIAFESEGGTCRGTLYLPSSTEEPPVVVAGPELGADRTFGLPAMAERFAANGVAVLLFDYRGFGESDGDDQRIGPARHRADYAAAVDRVADLDAVGNEVVVAGAGLAAAHAVAVAAGASGRNNVGGGTDIDAVMAITPILDGRAFLRDRGRKPFLRALLAGVRGATLGRVRGDREVPIAGDVDELAPVTDKRAYLDLVDRESDWRNATTARSLLRLARVDVTDTLQDLRVPTLVLAGTDDQRASVDRVERVAERIESAASHRAAVTFVEMPADHWSLYSADFESAVGHQLAFLRDALDG